MLNDTYRIDTKKHNRFRPAEMLSYRLGTNPATWPSLVVHSRAGDVKLHKDLVPSPYTGVSSYPQAIQNHLTRTLTEYGNVLARDLSRKFLINVVSSRTPTVYEYMSKDLANRLTAAEARKILEDPDERSIPWETAKAKLGR
jgi:hypothetical protein